MKYARVKDANNNLVLGNNGAPLCIEATKFQTQTDAIAFLKTLQTDKNNTLFFCCGHGSCRCGVHFRKEIKKVGGKKIRRKDQTWVSDSIAGHVSNCDGLIEYNPSQIKHNGLSLNDAALNPDEKILFHLNIDTGETAVKAFNRNSLADTADVRWRKQNQSTHSYYSVNTLSEFLNNIAKVLQISGKQGLERIYIAHEGRCTPLKSFIVRNNAEDRMNILEGDEGLYAKAQRRNDSALQSRNQWVFGHARLIMFEAAQRPELGLKADQNTKRINGWRYQTSENPPRSVYDQLNLSKTQFENADLFPNGAAVLAVPFIHQHQNVEFPIIHWSIKNNDNIETSPPKEIVKILCWKGQNIPHTPNMHVSKPRQLKLL